MTSATIKINAILRMNAPGYQIHNYEGSRIVKIKRTTYY